MKRLTSKQIQKILGNNHFFLERQKGSHMVFRHTLTRQICVVPQKKNELRTGTLKNIIRQSGLSGELFE